MKKYHGVSSLVQVFNSKLVFSKNATTLSTSIDNYAFLKIDLGNMSNISRIVRAIANLRKLRNKISQTFCTRNWQSECRGAVIRLKISLALSNIAVACKKACNIILLLLSTEIL